MAAWFASGWPIDAIIGLTVLEGIALALYHRATGKGLAPHDYALNLVAGLFLMLALRAVLGAAQWPWIALCLMAAGLAHGADIWRRWARSARQRPVRPS